MYDLLRAAMFRVPPERIHTVVFAGLRAATATAPARVALRRQPERQREFQFALAVSS